MLKLSESAQLENREKNLKRLLLYKVVNNPDTLLKSHVVGYPYSTCYVRELPFWNLYT